jgi:hypothetical protein
MYGLPADTNLSFLQDKLLTQVSFGEHQAQLHFHEENIHIFVESAFEFETADGSFEKYVVGSEPDEGDIVHFSNKLTQLLGSTVERVEWVANGTLTLTFSGHGKLRILDDDPRYEAYQIRRNEDFFVV